MTTRLMPRSERRLIALGLTPEEARVAIEDHPDLDEAELEELIDQHGLDWLQPGSGPH